MLRIALLLLPLIFQDEAKPLPEVRSFLAEVRKSLHTDDLLLSDYTYTETRTTIELDSNRKPKKNKVNVFQVFPGTCERPGYRRQIVKDGVPVPEKELAKQDREHQKQIESGQSSSRRGPPWRRRGRPDCTNRSEDEKIINDLFGVYDIRIEGREAIAGHSVLLVTFQPRRDYKAKTRQGDFMKHVAGRAWISESDHQLARLEAEVIKDVSVAFGMLAKLKKGTRISAERRKINDEVWLPARSEVLVGARLFLLKGMNVQEIVEYSDHKKFTVDTILSFPEKE